MQTILLSIKPEFASLIFEGKKTYEFRRVIFKSQQVERVVVYSSSPIQKIVGEFTVEYVVSKCVKKLWKETRSFAGIGKVYYDEYFSGLELGHAIKIGPVTKYDEPLCLKKEYGIDHPPQSFMYLPRRKH